jgi:hypothetical protein
MADFSELRARKRLALQQITIFHITTTIAGLDVCDSPCILRALFSLTFHPSKSWLNSLNSVLQSVWREFALLITLSLLYNHNRESEHPRLFVRFIPLVIVHI